MLDPTVFRYPLRTGLFTALRKLYPSALKMKLDHRSALDLARTLADLHAEEAWNLSQRGSGVLVV